MPFPLTNSDSPSAPVDGRDYAFLLDLVIAIGFGSAAMTLLVMQAGPVEAMTVVGFICAALLLWWAWLGQVWFTAAAGSHDPRPGGLAWLCDLAAIAGGLVLAIGIPGLASGAQVQIALAGYAVMRLALAARWGLRVGTPGARGSEALARARSIVIALIYWVVLAVVVPGDAPLFVPLFLFGAACEVALTLQAARPGAFRGDAGVVITRHARLVQLLLGVILAQMVIGQFLLTGALAEVTSMLWPALMVALITLSLWSLYAGLDQRAATGGMARLRCWLVGHAALFIALAAMSGSLIAIKPAFRVAGSTGLGIAAACAVLAIWAIGPALARDEAIRRQGWWLPACAAAIIGGIWLTPAPLTATALILLLTSWLAATRRRS